MSEEQRASWDERPVTARDLFLSLFVGAVLLAGAVVAVWAVTRIPQPAPVPAEPVLVAVPQQPVVEAGAVTGGAQPASEGAALFTAKGCAGCHTVGGGDLTGPDLQGVTERRERDWLLRWIAAPDQVLAEGDPIATQLFQQYNQVPMPALGLSEAEVVAILAYLADPTAAGGEGSAATAPNLVAGDAAVGRELFLGQRPLANGGPGCISCHSTTQVGALGGGTLGPDLTKVLARYGEAGLPTTLQNLPFPTMRGVFGSRPLTDSEVAHLYAYFAQTNQASARPVDFNFVWIGLAAFVLLGALAHLIWRTRLTAVRKPLLGGAK